jgi:Flp pilus assembly protein TadG
MILPSALAISCRRLAKRLRARRISGSAAIEFAMIAPVLFLFIFGIIETGVIFFASSTLQNATDDTARQIRTGQLSGTLTASQIRSVVCGEAEGLISDCLTGLMVDLRAYSSFTGASYPSVSNSDGSINTGSLAVQATADCDIVLLRTFYAWKIMTPLMSTLLQTGSTGTSILTSSAAFRTEPYTSSSTC